MNCYGFGYNGQGQLGVGDDVDRDSPQPVRALAATDATGRANSHSYFWPTYCPRPTTSDVHVRCESRLSRFARMRSIAHSVCRPFGEALELYVPSDRFVESAREFCGRAKARLWRTHHPDASDASCHLPFSCVCRGVQ